MKNASNPKITVYIPCHNYGSFLEQSVESVLRQTYDDYEILIIDDGSRDNTQEVIDLYRHVPNIRCFRTEGVGLPSVCNLALKEARGEYIIRLDGDDVFDPNILLILERHLDRNPDIALVFPDYYLMDMDGTVFAHEQRLKLNTEDHMLDIPPNGACILAHTAILRELGGYRTDLGAQDGFDLWTKVVEKHKCDNVNLPLFFYRRHNQNLSGEAGLSERILFARHQIKKDIALKKLKDMRPISVIIPVRTYFDFTPNIWAERIGRRTLLHHSISTCLESDLFDNIVVTSDNKDVRKIIEKFEDDRLVFVERTFNETSRSASLVDTCNSVITAIDPEGKGVSVLKYVQSPFLSSRMLEESIYTLAVNDADASIAVEQHREEKFYKQGAFGLEKIEVARAQHLDGGVLYRDANVCTAFKNAIAKKGSITGPRMASFTVPSAETFFINSSYKLNAARAIARELSK